MTASGRRPRIRRVAVVTGTRAEYGLLRSTMEAIARHRDLRLQLVVTGMHLLRKFGHTIDEISRDGWRIDARIRMQAGDDGPLDQAIGLARGIDGIARFCEQAKTHVVVVLGDRIEAMAGALAAVTSGRLLAHIHGGDVACGDFDEPLRHAITKLAHLHLAATRAARRRITRMGEDVERAHWVGAPGLDRLIGMVGDYRERNKRSNRALILHHACGHAPAHEKRVMNAVLKAVTEADLTRLIIYPNSDRGHAGIVEAIEVHRRRFDKGAVLVARSLDRDAYLRALIEADLLVGNSSSGIIEAASAGTPAVNVGGRQTGRDRSGTSVVDAGESVGSIRDAIGAALRKRPIRGGGTRYGDGRSGDRIADLLASMPWDDRFRRKAAAATASARHGPNPRRTS